MNELNGSTIVQNFGLELKSTQSIIESLNLFISCNLDFLIDHKILLNINNDTVKDSKFFSPILYLQLVIERILTKLLLKVNTENIRSLIHDLIALLFSDYFLYSSELKLNQTSNDLKLQNFNLIESAINNIDNILKELRIYSIEEDILGNLYQDLIHSNNRYQKGEFYTPNWLVKDIVNEIWDEIEQKKEKLNHIKILDPSCGSGVFLINILNRALKEGYFTSINEILESIHGFDINNLSLLMTKANFVLIVTLNAELIKNLKFNLNNDPFNNIDTLAINNSKNSLQNFVEEPNKENYFNKFDIIVGNPPWITMKSITDVAYQEKIKKQYFYYNLIGKKQTHLFTQLEMASLFYNKVIDIYLKQHGLICFVMPKSVILKTKHNENFQKFAKPQSKLLKIWDLQNIQNLFGMPACVLFGRKGKETIYPVDLEILHEVKSADFKNSTTITYKVVKSEYTFSEKSSKLSDYYQKFKVGASIFPRNLYFIEIVNQTKNSVQIKNDPSINLIAKKQWKEISLNGFIDKTYLYCTLLAWELVPFGFLHMRLITLPISINNKHVKIVPRENMDINSQKWFEQANSYWIMKNTEKSKKRFPSLIDRLNYNNLLIKQELKEFIVLYSGTGTNICSCVIARKETDFFEEKQLNFIADVKTWMYETDSEKEAYYLSAMLNSPYLNELIKPLQPQGLGGGRAIHRRPLQFPIMQFEPTNNYHMKLSDLSKAVHKTIKKTISEGKIKTRKDARKMVSTELNEISNITKLLLK